MAEKFDEELRQNKLSRMKNIEIKLQEYREVYNVIKENIVIKFTKTLASHTVALIISLIATVSLLLYFSVLFHENIIQIIGTIGYSFTKSDMRIIDLIKGYYVPIKAIFFWLFIFLSIIASLMRKNINKRNTIYALSKLVEEVITYMEDNLTEEKQRYGYFLENTKPTYGQTKEQEEGKEKNKEDDKKSEGDKTDRNQESSENNKDNQENQDDDNVIILEQGS